MEYEIVPTQFGSLYNHSQTKFLSSEIGESIVISAPIRLVLLFECKETGWLPVARLQWPETLVQKPVDRFV